jgi:hypothetical protein
MNTTNDFSLSKRSALKRKTDRLIDEAEGLRGDDYRFYLRMPSSLEKTLREIEKRSRMSKNGIILSILIPALNQRLKDLMPE